MRSLLVLVVLLSTVAAIGQDKHQAELVDEFGDVQCDEYLARIDSFYIQMANNPTMQGAAVISGANEHLLRKLILELRFRSGTARPGTGQKPIPVIRGEEIGPPKMSFLLFPPSLKLPESAKWDVTIPVGTKPAAFHIDYDGICSYRTLHLTVSELLAANPKLRVNIVLQALKPNGHSKLEQEVRLLFTSEERKRIRFFRQRSDYPCSSGDSAEYWLLP